MNFPTFILLAILVAIMILVFRKLKQQGSPCAGCADKNCPSHK